MLLVASSPTKPKLLKLINEFYFSENCIITDDDIVVNTKLNKALGFITFEKNKFRYFVEQ